MARPLADDLEQFLDRAGGRGDLGAVDGVGGEGSVRSVHEHAALLGAELHRDAGRHRVPGADDVVGGEGVDPVQRDPQQRPCGLARGDVDRDRRADGVGDHDDSRVAGPVFGPQRGDGLVEDFGVAGERPLVGGEGIAAAVAGPVEGDRGEPVRLGDVEQGEPGDVEVAGGVAASGQAHQQRSVRGAGSGRDPGDPQPARGVEFDVRAHQLLLCRWWGVRRVRASRGPRPRPVRCPGGGRVGRRRSGARV